jgi:hypothetical protein
MIKIGIVPCQNGMGHISRSIDLANALSFKFQVFLISDPRSWKKFIINKNVKKIKFISNFKIKYKKYNQQWYKKLDNSIKNIDLNFLISDNLPEIVFLKYKCIIMANFFWHEIYKIKNDKLKKTLEIIKLKKIKIFRNKIFKKDKKFSSIGFIGNINNNKNNSGLLISFSSLDKKNMKISKEINKIIYDKERKETLYLDPKYFKKHYNKFNVKIADYSQNMYSKVKFAFIKPGLGTIKDCLKNKIIIFSYLNKNYNKEFFNNANALCRNNMGYKTTSLLKSYINMRRNKIFINLKVKKSFFNGEKKIFRYIEDNIKI